MVGRSPDRYRSSVFSGRQHLGYFVDVIRRVQPLLVFTDQECKIFGHEPSLDCANCGLFKTVREFDYVGRAVELTAIAQSGGPGKNGGDWIGRRLLALLVFAE